MAHAPHILSGWKIIRLELARAPEFPQGSPSRAFLLRLPLCDDGYIHEQAMLERPGMATVRRFWPNEADQQGHVIRSGPHWAFSNAIGEDDDENLCHLEAHALRQGEYVTLTKPDGRQLPFRIVRID
jgi:hypothetical protein